MKKTIVVTAFIASFLALSGQTDVTAGDDDLPPPPVKIAESLSRALKAIRGERPTNEERDLVLLEDNTVVELIGPLGKHDAYIFFNHVACKEAVPILISSLSGYRDLKAKGHTVFECTWIHLRGALMAQTGEDFAFDQVAWQAWWNSKGKNLPEMFFEKNILKRRRANSEHPPAS